MAETEKKESDDDAFLERVRKHYKLCVEADKGNRDQAREALAFRNLEQWDQKLKHARENDPEGPRPCLVVDKLNQHVQQVVNDERQNRPQIKVRPVDNKGDPEVAKILDGIIRHIQDASHADIAYDTGFEHAVDGGFGYWRILTEYCDPLSFEQDLRIKRIRNRFAVYLDPERQEPDGSDAKYGFILYKTPKEQFKAEYGKDAADSLADFEFAGREFVDWYGEEWVQLAEYYWIEKEKTKIVMLADADGTVMTKDEYEALELPVGMQKPAIQAERESEIPKVRWRTLTANKVFKTTEWPGYCIPIVEVVGNELDVEGRVYRTGMIRPAMDAQRVDNFATSAFVEQVALAPRAPWTAAAGQIEGYENEWRTANRRNISVLPYKPISIDGTLVPPPQRQPPPGIPMGWQAVLMQAEHNIQAAMGRYDASLGEESNEKSGKAIMARQRKGDVGSFHFQDNLTRSLRHTGRILLEVLPKYYDTKRVARIIGEDGTPSSVTVDPNLADEAGNPVAYREVEGANGKIEKIYNIGVGKYDVTVVAGPSYVTRRLESAEAMLEISRGNNDFLMNFGDIVFKSQDWPGAEQIAERYKKILPPKLTAQEDDEPEPMVPTPGGPVPISQAAEMMAGMAQQLEAAGEQMKAGEDLKEQLALVEKAKTEVKSASDALAAKQREFELRVQLAEAQAQCNSMQMERGLREQAEARRAEDEQMKSVEEKERVDAASVLAEPVAAVAQSLAVLGDGLAQQGAAIVELAKVSAARRKTTLLHDDSGLPVGSVSEVEMEA